MYSSDSDKNIPVVNIDEELDKIEEETGVLDRLDELKEQILTKFGVSLSGSMDDIDLLLLMEPEPASPLAYTSSFSEKSDSGTDSDAHVSDDSLLPRRTDVIDIGIPDDEESDDEGDDEEEDEDEVDKESIAALRSHVKSEQLKISRIYLVPDPGMPGFGMVLSASNVNGITESEMEEYKRINRDKNINIWGKNENNELKLVEKTIARNSNTRLSTSLTNIHYVKLNVHQLEKFDKEVEYRVMPQSKVRFRAKSPPGARASTNVLTDCYYLEKDLANKHWKLSYVDINGEEFEEDISAIKGLNEVLEASNKSNHLLSPGEVMHIIHKKEAGNLIKNHYTLRFRLLKSDEITSGHHYLSMIDQSLKFNHAFEEILSVFEKKNQEDKRVRDKNKKNIRAILLPSLKKDVTKSEFWDFLEEKLGSTECEKHWTLYLSNTDEKLPDTIFKLYISFLEHQCINNEKNEKCPSCILQSLGYLYGKHIWLYSQNADGSLVPHLDDMECLLSNDEKNGEIHFVIPENSTSNSNGHSPQEIKILTQINSFESLPEYRYYPLVKMAHMPLYNVNAFQSSNIPSQIPQQFVGLHDLVREMEELMHLLKKHNYYRMRIGNFVLRIKNKNYEQRIARQRLILQRYKQEVLCSLQYLETNPVWAAYLMCKEQNDEYFFVNTNTYYYHLYVQHVLKAVENCEKIEKINKLGTELYYDNYNQSTIGTKRFEAQINKRKQDIQNFREIEEWLESITSFSNTIGYAYQRAEYNDKILRDVDDKTQPISFKSRYLKIENGELRVYQSKRNFHFYYGRSKISNSRILWTSRGISSFIGFGGGGAGGGFIVFFLLAGGYLGATIGGIVIGLFTAWMINKGIRYFTRNWRQKEQYDLTKSSEKLINRKYIKSLEATQQSAQTPNTDQQKNQFAMLSNAPLEDSLDLESDQETDSPDRLTHITVRPIHSLKKERRFSELPVFEFDPEMLFSYKKDETLLEVQPSSNLEKVPNQHDLALLKIQEENAKELQKLRAQQAREILRKYLKLLNKVPPESDQEDDLKNFMDKAKSHLSSSEFMLLPLDEQRKFVDLILDAPLQLKFEEANEHVKIASSSVNSNAPNNAIVDFLAAAKGLSDALKQVNHLVFQKIPSQIKEIHETIDLYLQKLPSISSSDAIDIDENDIDKDEIKNIQNDLSEIKNLLLNCELSKLTIQKQENIVFELNKIKEIIQIQAQSQNGLNSDRSSLIENAKSFVGALSTLKNIISGNVPPLISVSNTSINPVNNLTPKRTILAEPSEKEEIDSRLDKLNLLLLEVQKIIPPTDLHKKIESDDSEESEDEKESNQLHLPIPKIKESIEELILMPELTNEKKLETIQKIEKNILLFLQRVNNGISDKTSILAGARNLFIGIDNLIKAVKTASKILVRTPQPSANGKQKLKQRKTIRQLNDEFTNAAVSQVPSVSSHSLPASSPKVVKLDGLFDLLTEQVTQLGHSTIVRKTTVMPRVSTSKEKHLSQSPAFQKFVLDVVNQMKFQAQQNKETSQSYSADFDVYVLRMIDLAEELDEIFKLNPPLIDSGQVLDYVRNLKSKYSNIVSDLSNTPNISQLMKLIIKMNTDLWELNNLLKKNINQIIVPLYIPSSDVSEDKRKLSNDCRFLILKINSDLVKLKKRDPNIFQDFQSNILDFNKKMTSEVIDLKELFKQLSQFQNDLNEHIKIDLIPLLPLDLQFNGSFKIDASVMESQIKETNIRITKCNEVINAYSIDMRKKNHNIINLVIEAVMKVKKGESGFNVIDTAIDNFERCLKIKSTRQQALQQKHYRNNNRNTMYRSAPHQMQTQKNHPRPIQRTPTRRLVS